MSVEDFNMSETITGTRGVYRKVPTPQSINTDECTTKCALNKGPDQGLCPHRNGIRLGTMDCVRRSDYSIRFVWELGSPDFRDCDEGGVV